MVGGEADHPDAGVPTMELLLGILHLVLFIWALVNIWGSGAAGLAKLLWTLAVFFFPLVGLIIWFFLGPKKG
jgi:hypothetical protein